MRSAGDVLKSARKAKGLSQQAVAEAAGITQAYLSRLESGDRTNVELETLERVANVLGLKVELLPAIEEAATTAA